MTLLQDLSLSCYTNNIDMFQDMKNTCCMCCMIMFQDVVSHIIIIQV
jgi:hypothetical protein